MKFQVEAVNERGRRVSLSKTTYDYENVYTMLVGRNATGKSRLLGRIANHYLFPSQEFYHAIDTSYGSESAPRQVIVISNSRYDKFPDPIRSARERAGSPIAYHYLASGSDRFYSPYKVLSAAFATMLDPNYGSLKKEGDLFRVLDYIGFLPACSFEIRRVSFAKEFDDFDRRRTIGERFDFNQEEFDSDLSPRLQHLDFLLRGKRSLTVRLDAYSGLQTDISLHDFSTVVPRLIKAGILRISRLTLYSKESKDKVLFHQASSGQQCMLLLFLGLSGVMVDGSLVCIDEPEISLHPKWQAEFIGLLQENFSHYAGCHFLIATHSPQVVSGLTSKNGFVADLENNELLPSSDYAKKSADFQLSEVFHEPGYKNEYLIRTLLVMLSKLSKGGRLSDNDHQRLSGFETLRGRLDTSDPVLHLLDQIKMLVD